jgi:hypothetical protein
VATVAGNLATVGEHLAYAPLGGALAGALLAGWLWGAAGCRLAGALLAGWLGRCWLAGWGAAGCWLAGALAGWRRTRTHMVSGTNELLSGCLGDVWALSLLRWALSGCYMYLVAV